MKSTCQQNVLQKAINIVGKTVGTQNTLPVLNNILITCDTEQKKLNLCSTNLEIGIQTEIDAEVNEAGSVTVPAKLITSYINYLRDEEINLSSNEQAELSLKSAASKSVIKGIPAEEFPSIPQVEGAFSFSVPVKDFIEAISLTVFSSSANTTKPVLNGVLLKGSEKILTITATDSFRLSEKKLSLEQGLDDFTVIIPSATLAEVSRVFSQVSSSNIEIHVSENQICFSSDGIKITSRLIDGKYPDYEQIIPKENPIKAIFPREETLMVLKRISFFARENNNSVHISLSPSKAVFSTESNQYGSEEDEMNIECSGGESDIYLNIDFLLEIFNNIKSDEVIFEMNTNMSPACIRMHDDENYIHIIMPLKI